MSKVNVPGSQPSMYKQAVPVAGSLIGGYFGGPAGAAAGGKIGSSLVKGGPDPGAVEGKGSSPMQRRIEQAGDDPQTQLAKAQQALQQLPPEDQQKYGPALTEAQKRAQQGAV